MPHGVCWMSRLLNIDGSATSQEQQLRETVSAKLTKPTNVNRRDPTGVSRQPASAGNLVSVVQKCKSSGESERERRTESDALRRAPLAEPCRVAAVVVLVDLEPEHPRFDELVIPLLVVVCGQQ